MPSDEVLTPKNLKFKIIKKNEYKTNLTINSRCIQGEFMLFLDNGSNRKQT